MKITKDTPISDLISIDPELAMVFLDTGMACVGCPMAQQETIEQGCIAHGMSEDEMNKLINELNNKVKEDGA